MSPYIKARLAEMTKHQIQIINGKTLHAERVSHLNNARAVFCTLSGMEKQIAMIDIELFLINGANNA